MKKVESFISFFAAMNAKTNDHMLMKEGTAQIGAHLQSQMLKA